MTCAACAARVQARLSKIDGGSASVNYATGRARVAAPAGMPPAALISAVRATGYTAELVSATPGPVPEPHADRARARYLGRRLILALVFFIPLSDLSVLTSLFPSDRFAGWQWLLVGLAVPVAGWAAWPFHAAAIRGLRHGTLTMDTLVSMGIAAACGWSGYAMFVLDRGQARLSPLDLLWHASGGGIYLEVAASVTTFLLAGRWYEARARYQAGDAMRALAAAAPQQACLLADDGSEHRVPAASLRAGQRLVVRPGERIAADGVVASGCSAVDRSMMTGEAAPVEAAAGDSVTAGTVALTGRLVVRAVRVGADT
jgi:Cu+-exporting ATPase